MTGEILAATLRYRRRGLKRQTLRTADMLFAAWATLVVLIRFALNCALAVRELRGGSRAVGLALAEFCALHALGVALLFSFLVSSLLLGTIGLDRRRLLLSPVSFPALMLSEIAGLLASPVSALVTAFVVPAAVPLLLLPQPTLAVCALLASFAAAILIGSALSMAVSLSPRGRGVAGLFRGAFAAVLLTLVLANFDFQWKAGPISLFVFMKRTLLDDGAGRGLLAALRPWSPSSWIAARGVSPAVGLLLSVGLATASVALFGLLLSRALQAAGQGPRRESSRTSRKPGRVSAGARRSPATSLFSHELGLLASRGATRFGALAAAGFAAWTLASREASVNIPLLGAILVLASLFPYASNLFGADGYALRRYVMLSPDWGAIFAARNAACLAGSAALLAPLVVVAAVRISGAAALSLALSALLVAVAHVLWGNVSSILIPSAEGGTGAQPPGFANQVALLAAWGLPLALDRSLARFGTPLYDAAAGACVLAGVLLGGIMLRRAREHFDKEVEGVLGRM
jgi:hypothetical protein